MDRAIEDHVVQGLHALSVVDEPSFENILKVAEPRYVVPSRGTVVNRLKQRYESMTRQLVLTILTVQFCAITHDAWTSLATQSFCAITIHFITKDWQLKSLCLETKNMPERHTAENLAANLQDAQNRWKFKTPIAVSDNAANEVKAFKLLNWTRISCFGHNLNLVVKASLQIPEISELISKCRRVAEFFHRSPNSSHVLKRKQQALLDESKWDLKVIHDVSTRWNSTLDMIQRIVILIPAINAAFQEEELKKSSAKHVFSVDDQQSLEKIIKVQNHLKTRLKICLLI